MRSRRNKFIQIGLILLVIVIWGLAVSRFTEDDKLEAIEIALPKKRKLESKLTSQDNRLIANYRDPFLDEYLIVEDSELIEEEIVNSEPVIQQTINWPELLYHGKINNRYDKMEVGLFTINGKSHLLSKGSVTEGIKIEKFYQDSVKLIFSNEFKTIGVVGKP